MFKFFLSRSKALLKEKRFVFPAQNAAELIPAWSSYLTDCCPVLGKWFVNGLVRIFYGNRLFLRWAYRRQRSVAAREKIPGPILVVADLNIGDAINLQVACTTLKQLFPDRKIHYAINHKAFGMLTHHPDIDRVIPIFSGAAIPTDEDIVKLNEISGQSDYTLIFNFCPFFTSETFSESGASVLNHYPLTMEIANNELRGKPVHHLRPKIFHYLTLLFPEATQKYHPVLKDAAVYLDEESMGIARAFLKEHGLLGKEKLVLFNPDATSRYTRFPKTEQIRLLENLLKSETVVHLLLGSGFVFQHVEQELLQKLGTDLAQKVTIIPKIFSLETYAALIDACDLYVTNDTGPLHIAATRKNTHDRHPLRNRTAVYAIFGATPAHIYAYDSTGELYFPAPQDAPSRVFVSESKCRNVTCVNKLSKKCKTVRCFDGLNPELMADEMIRYLKN
ncbi:MAG: glycosyltransferase family 9 protein [Bacteroidales bacterium]|nr:glycosyltransferase family 9 protein [Bacteroidales bacterium]